MAKIPCGPLDGSKKTWLLYNARAMPKDWDFTIATLREGTSLVVYDPTQDQPFWLQDQADLDEALGSGVPGLKYFNAATVKVQAELNTPLPVGDTVFANAPNPLAG